MIASETAYSKSVIIIAFLDARRGFEPRLLGSEPSVLPLDERAKISAGGSLKRHRITSMNGGGYRGRTGDSSVQG